MIPKSSGTLRHRQSNGRGGGTSAEMALSLCQPFAPQFSQSPPFSFSFPFAFQQVICFSFLHDNCKMLQKLPLHRTNPGKSVFRRKRPKVAARAFPPASNARGAPIWSVSPPTPLYLTIINTLQIFSFPSLLAQLIN